MKDGSTKRIRDIQVGDQVLSRNPDTGKDEAKTVTATIERHAPSVVDVVLHDAKTGKAETLTCTPEHPLYVQGQGWVEAGSLGIGTSIVSRAGPALEVTNLTWEKNKTQELAAGSAGNSFGGYTVYNLTVDGDHTFFVGTANGGTWAHNASCGNVVADAISNGHAFTKHILNEGQWAGLGLRTREQFARFIDDIMQNASGSNVRSLANGRTAYWDNATGTVVIHNPRAGDLGTTFQPTNGFGYFTNLH